MELIELRGGEGGEGRHDRGGRRREGNGEDRVGRLVEGEKRGRNRREERKEKVQGGEEGCCWAHKQR
jgi:hypothetical protein